MRASSLGRARQLRRNQTKAELELWMRLRGRQLGANSDVSTGSDPISSISAALNGGW
jgi:hypothetical protein